MASSKQKEPSATDLALALEVSLVSITSEFGIDVSIDNELIKNAAEALRWF